MANNRDRVDPHSTEITSLRAEELGRCFKSYIYFIDKYCKIYDSVEAGWIPFSLWPSQKKLLLDIHANQLTVILKARQLGISWLSLGYALWHIMFRPIAAVSIFSRRETEAIYMLSAERMRGMFDNLPPWMKTGHETKVDSGKEWILRTGSAVRAFPTSAGDGYVSTLAIVDEADLSPDLNALLGAVKPTIDNGGKLVLLSRVNKSEPMSEFKAIYKGAKAGDNGWFPVFLPWKAHPSRDDDWYERQRRECFSRTGATDDLWEHYPATDTEALAEKTLDKRIPPMWIEVCFKELKPIQVARHIAIPGLVIYFAPEVGVRYVLGADPAEGNPNSDDSSLTVLNITTGEEVASLAGKHEPAVFANYITQVSQLYNYAPAMIERNNHGHSVIQWMQEHGRRTRLLFGHDAEKLTAEKKTVKQKRRIKPGWLSSTLGKTILYTITTEFFRTNANFDQPEVGSSKVLHNLETYSQLCSIEAESLSAPKGKHDDRADSFALAVAGRQQVLGKAFSGMIQVSTVKGWGM